MFVGFVWDLHLGDVHWEHIAAALLVIAGGNIDIEHVEVVPVEGHGVVGIQHQQTEPDSNVEPIGGVFVVLAFHPWKLHGKCVRFLMLGLDLGVSGQICIG